MQFGELRARIHKCPKILGEGDMRQITLQIGGVAFAIIGVVQEPVGIVENLPLADGIVAVVRAELLQRPVGDVFSAVRAIFIVDVEGEALGTTGKLHIRESRNHQRVKGFV